MKLQVYYDPWLHYLNELVPSAEKVARKRCQDELDKLERSRKWWKGQVRIAQSKHATILKMYYELKAQPREDKDRVANLERRSETALKAYEQQKRLTDALQDEKKRAWNQMSQAYDRDLSSLRQEIFKLRAENASLRGALSKPPHAVQYSDNTFARTRWISNG